MGNWLLYIGIFLCCTGVGVIPGAILIFVWGINQITDKKVSEKNYTHHEHRHQYNPAKLCVKQQRRKIRRDAIHTKHNDSTPMDLPSPAWDHIYSNETREAWK